MGLEGVDPWSVWCGNFVGLMSATRPAMPSNACWLRKKLGGSGSSGPGNNIGGGSGRGVEDFDFVDLRFLVTLEDGRDIEEAPDDERADEAARD